MSKRKSRKSGRRFALALTAQVTRLNFLAANFCQGSSVVEQGTHKPLVGSSTLPPGMFSVWLGSIFFEVLRADITSVQPSISTRGLGSICVVTLRLQNDSEIRLKLLQRKK
jgi:hypothetical protein